MFSRHDNGFQYMMIFSSRDDDLVYISYTPFLLIIGHHFCVVMTSPCVHVYIRAGYQDGRQYSDYSKG